MIRMARARDDSPVAARGTALSVAGLSSIENGLRRRGEVTDASGNDEEVE
jgi:hypothetical protein